MGRHQMETHPRVGTQITIRRAARRVMRGGIDLMEGRMGTSMGMILMTWAGSRRNISTQIYRTTDRGGSTLRNAPN